MVFAGEARIRGLGPEAGARLLHVDARARQSLWTPNPARITRAGVRRTTSSACGLSPLIKRVASRGKSSARVPSSRHDPLETPEELEVLPAQAGDDPHHGPDHLHQRPQLARMVGAHFQHRGGRIGRELQQGQRDPDVIVEAGRAAQSSEALTQRCRQQILGRGLAVGTADRDDRQAELGGR